MTHDLNKPYYQETLLAPINTAYALWKPLTRLAKGVNRGYVLAFNGGILQRVVKDVKAIAKLEIAH